MRLAKPAATAATLLASATTADGLIPRPFSPPHVAPAAGPPVADPVNNDTV